ncbi:glutathione S-transferase 1-1-like [Amblyomma americanum]
MPATLYCLSGSPPCTFVRSLAKHLNVELTLKTVDFSKKEHLDDDYLKMNPFHKVPTLDDDGFVIYESNAIAYYLLRKYAPESELYPSCCKERARIDQVLATVANTIQPQQLLFYRPLFCGSTKPTQEEVSDFEQNVLKAFEHLVGDGKFAIGDKLTLADLSLVSNLAIALETTFVDSAKFPKLASYYERVKSELPYFEEVYRPAIAFLQQHWAELK